MKREYQQGPKVRENFEQVMVPLFQESKLEVKKETQKERRVART